ncbi:MAG: Transposase domain protein [Planctomycetota bacterium]|nr:Transposase domain protein [Planctomycetota bacterium]
MTRRYEMTDEGFALIEGLLPPTGRPGGRWNDHRTTLNGISWALHTGAQWREVPERYGPWGTAYGRFRTWRADGTIDRILERLHVVLNERGLIENALWCVDATSSRAAAGAGGKKVEGEPEGHALGRSRGGFGTKLHLVVDGRGTPPSAVVTAGQAHESKSLEPALEAVRLRRPAPPAGRRQGVQLSPHPPLPEAARHQGGDPDTQGSAAEPALRQGRLSAPQCGGAVRAVAQGVPAPGDPVREVGGELPGHDQARHDPALHANP